MPAKKSIKGALALTGLMWLPFQAAQAASDPTGVWMNDTGRGAIEIKPCGAALCGHVVWVKDTNDTKGCGRQIIGNAAKVGANTWDNGWIYSPEKKQKYDVELKPLSNGTLQVMGYAGSKIFSKTMIWKRAPADLVRCGTQETIAKADPAAKPDANTKPETKTKAEAKTKPETKPETKLAAKPETEAAKPAPTEQAIVPPAPTPAERPAKPDSAPPQNAPVEVARAEPDAPATTAAEKSAAEAKPEPTPDVATSEPDDGKPVPQVHALPGEESNDNAPDVPTAADDTPPPAKKSLNMGKVAKRLAELERETGYGLKKTGKGNCRLNVPYATINFPCKN